MINVRLPLTKENIFNKITSYDVFKFYSSNFKEIGKPFISDLRNDDIKPSCCIAQIRGDLMYTDFGTNQTFRCIDFVMKKFGLTYSEALVQINNDFGLGLGYNIIPKKSEKLNKTGKLNPIIKVEEKLPTIIKKKSREFTKQDLIYWNQFYWTEQMLVDSGTQSISHFWINDQMFTINENELAFSYEYYWHNGRMQRKLYFPTREKFKWISNVDNTIVQLVDVAPKQGDILFITSSKKDAGIFWRMQIDNLFPNIVIHGVAPNNEGSFVPDKWFNKMKDRWKTIIIWYNNDWKKKDNPGVINAKKYAEKYQIPYYYNPDGNPKDPSDFVKEFGLIEFQKLVKQKLSGQ